MAAASAAERVLVPGIRKGESNVVRHSLNISRNSVDREQNNASVVSNSTAKQYGAPRSLRKNAENSLSNRSLSVAFKKERVEQQALAAVSLEPRSGKLERSRREAPLLSEKSRSPSLKSLAVNPM